MPKKNKKTHKNNNKKHRNFKNSKLAVILNI